MGTEAARPKSAGLTEALPPSSAELAGGSSGLEAQGGAGVSWCPKSGRCSVPSCWGGQTRSAWALGRLDEAPSWRPVCFTPTFNANPSQKTPSQKHAE